MSVESPDIEGNGSTLPPDIADLVTRFADNSAYYLDPT